MVYNDKIPDLDQLNRVCLYETKLYVNSYKPSFNDKTGTFQSFHITVRRFRTSKLDVLIRTNYNL